MNQSGTCFLNHYGYFPGDDMGKWRRADWIGGWGPVRGIKDVGEEGGGGREEWGRWRKNDKTPEGSI